MSGFGAVCRRISISPAFQHGVLLLILANAVLLGVETSDRLMARHGVLLMGFSFAIQVLFVAELAIRLCAHLPRPHRFFRDGWNVFDLAVVALSLLPQAGPSATVARLARVLRVSRLVSVWPDLRLIVGTMLRSISSMGHVIALLGLLLYVYGVLGFHLFHRVAPEYWGTLRRSVATLFQTLTLEGWVEVAERSHHTLSWLYFASFIVIAVFVVTNLFIAIVINNLDRVRAEVRHTQDDASAHHAVLARIEALKLELDALQSSLRQHPVEPRLRHTAERMTG
jgi:voltage-gated sodium channel